jgi:hypothetical protein
VSFLEVARADFGGWNLCRDSEHRHAAAMAIEQPVNQMKVTRTAAPRAHGQLAGHMRIGAGCEGRYLLMAHMDPLNRFLAPKRVGDAVE